VSGFGVAGVQVIIATVDVSMLTELAEPVKRKAMAEGKENGDSGKRPKLQGELAHDCRRTVG
jgi:hypothetical protein